MNVFDFDKTVYPKDSAAEFIAYIAIRHPSVIVDLARGVPWAFAYKRGKKSKTEMKQAFFKCFSRVPDIDKAVEHFWDKRMDRIEGWYMKLKSPDDVIISASPEFLLAEPCKRLGVTNLIASRVDKKTGKYSGVNCYGEEKPRRFAESFPNGQIDCFYSDSRSDLPMARIAKKAYMIKGSSASPWIFDEAEK